MFGAVSIGLPPILVHGTEKMKQQVAPACIRGEKIVALALTGYSVKEILYLFFFFIKKTLSFVLLDRTLGWK
jgi:hypothetical protein